MAWNQSTVIADNAKPRLVALDDRGDREIASAFAEPVATSLDLCPLAITKAKQAVLDDLRGLVLQGVEPRADELERNPSADSLAVAERLIFSLPDDIAMPTVCLPDDGEITFSWQTSDQGGENWRAVLAIAPNLEVECFVRRCSDQRPVAHFFEHNGTDLVGLSADIESALQSHWQRFDASR